MMKNYRSTIIGFATLVVLLSAGAAQSLAGSNTVTSDDILDGSVTSADIKDQGILYADIKDGSMTGKKILDKSITSADIAQEAWHAVAAANGTVCQESTSTTGMFCADGDGPSVNWHNWGSPFAPARFFRDALGIVHLEGLIAFGGFETQPLVFRLPAGYRPPADLMFSATCADLSAGDDIGTARFDVTSDGWIRWRSTLDTCTGGTSSYFSLAGWSFRVNP